MIVAKVKGIKDLLTTMKDQKIIENIEGNKSKANGIHASDRLFVGKKWSERRDLNPRRSPWQGDALPTELRSHPSKRLVN